EATTLASVARRRTETSNGSRAAAKDGAAARTHAASQHVAGALCDVQVQYEPARPAITARPAIKALSAGQACFIRNKLVALRGGRLGLPVRPPTRPSCVIHPHVTSDGRTGDRKSTRLNSSH